MAQGQWTWEYAANLMDAALDEAQDLVRAVREGSGEAQQQEWAALAERALTVGGRSLLEADRISGSGDTHRYVYLLWRTVVDSAPLLEEPAAAAAWARAVHRLDAVAPAAAAHLRELTQGSTFLSAAMQRPPSSGHEVTLEGWLGRTLTYERLMERLPAVYERLTERPPGPREARQAATQAAERASVPGRRVGLDPAGPRTTPSAAARRGRPG